ncbi:hypothetical protein niasHT_032437 [Heterodera trifolii]|uniref:Metalloprotease n=1 Tax=Heterodera trifolii TaxID=157864 RepID=A0ABD2HVK9_9BILA
MLKEEENKYCADKQPLWASWNIGIFCECRRRAWILVLLCFVTSADAVDLLTIAEHEAAHLLTNELSEFSFPLIFLTEDPNDGRVTHCFPEHFTADELILALDIKLAGCVFENVRNKATEGSSQDLREACSYAWTYNNKHTQHSQAHTTKQHRVINALKALDNVKSATSLLHPDPDLSNWENTVNLETQFDRVVKEIRTIEMQMDRLRDSSNAWIEHLGRLFGDEKDNGEKE